MVTLYLYMVQVLLVNSSFGNPREGSKKTTQAQVVTVAAWLRQLKDWHSHLCSIYKIMFSNNWQLKDIYADQWEIDINQLSSCKCKQLPVIFLTVTFTYINWHLSIFFMSLAWNWGSTASILKRGIVEIN